jgi:hypothetical protein
MYKEVKNMFGNVFCVLMQEDQKYIPFDPANTDYKEYLKWLSEGNIPLPADTTAEENK